MKNRLYRLVDRWAVRLADSLGITLARAEPLDLRGSVVHPLEGFYIARRYQPVLIDVPVSRLRGLGSAAFPCTPESGHPFIQTLLEYETGKVRDYAGSALDSFYQHWQPKNAAEYLGVESNSECTNLQSLKPVEAVFPWDKHDPQKQWENIQYAVNQSNVSQHVKISKDENRWHFFGPFSSAAGKLEYQRLISIFNSIKDNGYLRKNTTDGDIKGVLMLWDDDWCINISGGQHRCSVLSALGRATVPVLMFYQLPIIIRREDCSYWPHVVDGLFDNESAIRIFDRIFDGRQPWQDKDKPQKIENTHG